MKKSSKIIASLLVIVLVLMSPMSVYAMSQQNIIAQQALKKQLIADKRQYCNWVMDKIKYTYADVCFLPITNSPRMGVCGYEGSDIYPKQFEPDIPK